MFLDKIVVTKQQEVAELSARFSLNAYERTISDMSATLGFERAVSAAGRKRDMGLIAEVKKASPSKGLIREDFHPVGLAKAYEEAGTDCISVLTDRDYFQGSNDYLQAVREAVNVPLLRKDFTVDYRQIYEARVIGADAILLIAAILTKQQLSEFHDIAKSIGLDVLVEVHDQRELETVLELDKATLIGVNNRDLRSFVTDLKTTEQLIGIIPQGKGITSISESGIAGPEDVQYLKSVGAQGLLIGEHFMRKPHVGEAIEQLLGPVGVR
ncbi:Indole-3-glycerol-phosphate synthase [Paenibacillus curdlanolyticus YK9]|uniref:Indole-3-glycerol phosphate synthase n=1 Tax=Paenibacillus curdlanolyticus YK9 TaxID=717606 RepID=E0IC74_9BACL|nr:indole-3-glycerol phosphate synthase TrpC [Paenibacillus curdlanolyticus]EFM09760.1 Indole-3-glycerol-phosphate synthase [Paenibacillus curdlanolyticus YK9]